MVSRLILFSLLIWISATGLAQSQTSDVKDLQYAKKTLQLRTRQLDSIITAINLLSTHRMSPTAKAVYDFVAAYVDTSSAANGHVILENNTPKAHRDSLEFRANSTIVFAATNTSTRTIIEAVLESNSVNSAEIASDAVGYSELIANCVDSTIIINGGVSVLDINQNGASSGQTLKWNGTQWAPADASDGNGIYSGSGIIATSAVSTVDTSSLWKIAYSNDNAAIVIDDGNAATYIGSPDLDQYAQFDNSEVQIGADGALITYETNTLTIQPTAKDTIIKIAAEGTNMFGISTLVDTFNNAATAYKIGSLSGTGRIYLTGYEAYLQAPLRQVDNKGIEFRGSTGNLYIHPNGDYYTSTLTGDNETTNRNITWNFASGGINKGNPVIFRQVFSGNDTLCNSFEFFAKNTAGGGITHPDSILFRVGNYDRGTALNIRQNKTAEFGGPIHVGSISQPSSKAIAEFTSTTKGVLLPRMTTTQRDAITSPPAGLLIFNTTTTKMECYDGSTWQAAW